MMTPAVAVALQKAKEVYPGWVVAVLSRALMVDDPPPTQTLHKADSMDAVWQWAKSRLPICVTADGAQAFTAHSQATLKTTTRKQHDAAQKEVLEMVGADGARLVVRKVDIAQDVADTVPTASPKTPRIAFVGLAPTAQDAQQGEPLSGEDGAFFAAHYLHPMGLRKSDVMLTHCIPIAGEHDASALLPYTTFAKAELAAFKPQVTVALGQQAARHLGALADFTVPHPAGVRRGGGDVQQVTRRLKAVKARLDELSAADVAARRGIVVGKVDADDATKQVHIAKAVEDKRVVLGVVLDPYQFDSQGDWTPPAEIEQTCHDWMEQSRVIGLQHEGPADAVVVENWLWPYPTTDDYRAAMAGEPHQAYAAKFGDQIVHSGSWMIGVKIKDDATWAAVQAGLITAYSIGGSGVQTPATAASMPEVVFINA
jgi:uracil-DNA glycosylase family 4